MKLKLKLICVIYFAITAVSFGQVQDLNDFQNLKASGLVPEEFMTLSSEKSRADYEANKDEDLGKDFFLATRFFIDELLLSGNMLFEEELTDYLNKVAKYTLRTEKKLFKELRFYVLKSTTVNAFSTDQGIIIFTTGLLAQLENEAQLAYIIAHEVSHYTEHHVRNSYTEKQSLRKGNGKYQKLDYESRISTLSVYEKDNEFEADNKGIEIYLKSEYAVDEIFSSFEMLLYSYLPFNEVKFDSTFFDTDILKIPNAYFPDTTREITVEEDFDDENSSHPNIQKRMDAAFQVLNDRVSKGNEKFKVSEETFYKVRNLARFESVNILLAQREYGSVLYDIFLLRKDFPNNRFLDLSYVKALYGLAKYKNANRYREVTEKLKKIEGESFLLHYFLSKLDRQQMNVIAYRHIYDMSLKYPNDVPFQAYEKDFKKELAINSKIDFDELKEVSFASYMVETNEMVLKFDVQDSINKIDDSDLSKYEKIKRKKKLREIDADSKNPLDTEAEFYKFGLHDLVANGKFIDELEAIQEEADKKEEESDDFDAEKTPDNRDIRKLVVVDPVFKNYKLNKEQDLTKSEDQKVNLSGMFYPSYPDLNIETEILDSKGLGAESVNEYNEIGVVLGWLNEVLAHEDIDMISSFHDRMEPVQTKYGTDHFLFSGIFAYKDRHQMKGIHLYGIMFFYTIPLVLADLIVPHNYFELVAFSINAETDKVEFLTVSDVNLKSTEKVIEAYIYDVMYQLNNGEK